ncbi:MAG: S26 family signal peptidase, partial [Gemmiger sp.]
MTGAALRAEALALAKRAAALAVLLWVLFGLVFGLAAMPCDDMKPSLRAGDLLLYYRLQRDWSAQQVVVVRQDGLCWVGRVAARPGDTVEVTGDGRLLVNGSLVIEND